MFRRRRRRTRVQWMPNPGTGTVDINDTNIGAQNSGADFRTTTSNNAPTTILLPLVVDNPVQTVEAGAPMSVWQSQGLNQTQRLNWRLRRIVGKLFCSAGFTVPDPQNNTAPDAVLVQAGIIVRRVDDENGQPVVNTQDVANIDNNDDPWIWRRDWILSRGTSGRDNFGGVAINTDGLQNFPQTNAGYGSVKDGPHIDQKTNRVIGQEERLFLNITWTHLPLPASDRTGLDTNSIVYFNFQYRILGSVFQNAGNRRNASR